MTADPSRRLADAGATILIVYTVPAEAVARGYEPWLVETDNPFFNDVPGTRHYANWKVSRTLRGAPPAYDYFDFQGLDTEADLERVWFSPELDTFRKEWVRLWGYGSATPPPLLRHAYLMRPVARSAAEPTALGLVRGGSGITPRRADICWEVTHVLPKHYAGVGVQDGAWHLPVASGNPLGLDWITLDYGTAEEDLEAVDAERGPAGTAFLARLIAAPDGSAGG